MKESNLVEFSPGVSRSSRFTGRTAVDALRPPVLFSQSVWTTFTLFTQYLLTSSYVVRNTLTNKSNFSRICKGRDKVRRSMWQTEKKQHYFPRRRKYYKDFTFYKMCTSLSNT